jgi:hypothetical protein
MSAGDTTLVIFPFYEYPKNAKCVILLTLRLYELANRSIDFGHFNAVNCSA